MKKKITIFLLVVSVGLFASVTSHAQDSSTTAKEDIKVAAKKTGSATKKTAKKTGTAVAKTAKTVGNKSAELASKGASAVVDKVYKGKVGPDGQTIYITNKSKYYWVDKAGHRQYVASAQLKDKE